MLYMLDNPFSVRVCLENLKLEHDANITSAMLMFCSIFMITFIHFYTFSESTISLGFDVMAK